MWNFLHKIYEIQHLRNESPPLNVGSQLHQNSKEYQNNKETTFTGFGSGILHVKLTQNCGRDAKRNFQNKLEMAII